MAAGSGKSAGDKGAINVQTALKRIKAGEIQPVYLLYGDEEFLRERFLLRLGEIWLAEEANAFNTEKVDGRALSQAGLADAAGQIPFFSGRKLMLVDEPAFIPCGAEPGKGKKAGRAERGAAADGIAEDDADTGDVDGADGMENEGEGDGEKGGTAETRAARGRTAIKKSGKAGAGQPAEQPLADFMEQAPAFACIVLCCRRGRPDRRNKLVAAIAKKGGLVEAAALTAQERLPFLQETLQKEGKQCAPGVLEQISRRPEGMANCLRELEKVLIYAGEEKRITRDMLEKVLSPSLEANIFRMVDALGQRRRAIALTELRKLLDRGEAPFAIFAMMLRQYRLIFRAKAAGQAGVGRAQLAGALGVQSFVAEKAEAQSRLCSFAELEAAMALFLEKDLAMKSGEAYGRVLEDLVIGLGS